MQLPIAIEQLLVEEIEKKNFRSETCKEFTTLLAGAYAIIVFQDKHNIHRADDEIPRARKCTTFSEFTDWLMVNDISFIRTTLKSVVDTSAGIVCTSTMGKEARDALTKKPDPNRQSFLEMAFQAIFSKYGLGVISVVSATTLLVSGVITLEGLLSIAQTVFGGGN